MPFVCERCGGQGRMLDVSASGLTCRHCGTVRSFVRAPLMVVAGAAGAGKSTVCQRLAGTIDGVVLLDADTLAGDHVAVVSPRRDYPAFWRTLLHLAHEIAQNRCAVAYFGVTLPEQIMASDDASRLFASVDILALVCDEADLRRRIERRRGGDAAAARIGQHLEINQRLAQAARSVADVTAIDASRPPDAVAADVRRWLLDRSGQATR